MSDHANAPKHQHNSDPMRCVVGKGDEPLAMDCKTWIHRLARCGTLLAAWTVSLAACADDVAIRALDRASQAQAAALDILQQHHQFEEELVKRERDRLTVFFSTRQAENLSLAEMTLLIDGKRVASHHYSPEEQRGLQGRFVQLVHSARIETGVHEMQFILQLDTGATLQVTPRRFTKGRHDKFIEIQLTGGAVRSFAEFEW